MADDQISDSELTVWASTHGLDLTPTERSITYLRELYVLWVKTSAAPSS